MGENNFYLQSMAEDAPVKESVAVWSVWCKDIPFQLYGKMKEPAKRTWHDEHGDEEFIADGGLYVESYTMKVELGCKAQDTVVNEVVTATAQENVRNNVRLFLEYLRSSGMLKVYSTYTGIGRRYVRLESVGDDATWKEGDDGWWFLLFDVTLKVNDPVTDMVLTGSGNNMSIEVRS